MEERKIKAVLVKSHPSNYEKLHLAGKWSAKAAVWFCTDVYV